MKTRAKFLTAAFLLSSSALFAQQGTTAAQAPNTDTSYIDADGTAHITRVIPGSARPEPRSKKIPVPSGLRRVPTRRPSKQRRSGTDAWQNHAGDVSAQLYPVNRSESTIAGVPVRIVTPLAGMDPDRVLHQSPRRWLQLRLRLLTESIPIANLTKIKVVAVLYRLAPGASLPCRPRRRHRRLQRAAQNLQARTHRHLRNLSRRHPHRRSRRRPPASSAFPSPARSASSPAWATSPATATPGPCTPSTDSPAISIRPNPALTTPTTSPPPIPTIPSSRRSSPTCSNMPPTLFITSGRDILLSGTTILAPRFSPRRQRQRPARRLRRPSSRLLERPQSPRIQRSRRRDGSLFVPV